MAHIVVLFHKNEIRRDPTAYVIHKLADTWRARGDKVTYLFGPQTYVPADVVIVHVDLSVVPEPYLEFSAQYSVVLNGDLRDIRKTRISRTLVKPGDGWHGPVIVKSDLNYFGRPERMLEGNWLERRWDLTRRISRAGERVRWWNMPVREAREYAVFGSADEIPSRWFSYGGAVIERFLPEVENGLYHLRMVQVLGNRRVGTLLASRDPIVRAGSSIAAVEMEPHDVVDEWCAEHHVDYGKFDYVIHDGEAILLDVNKTIGATPGYRDERDLARSRQYLAEGLYGYLE